MDVATPVVAALPTARPAGRPFDPPDELIALRDHTPLTRMRYPDGHVGWLATGFAPVRAVLGDRRFSSRHELMHFPLPLPEGLTQLPPAPLGDMTGIDPPEHTRYRSQLVGFFTVRRMRALTEQVSRIADTLLDELLDAPATPAVDLVEGYARPLPALVICELLGVPYAERDFFHSRTMTLTDQRANGVERVRTMHEIETFLCDMVADKRAHPTDDVIGAMTSSDLSDDELAGLGGFLVSTGFDTAANVIALAVFALLEHPEQLSALRSDPEGLTGAAVEELLRWLTIAHTNVRAALTDVDIDGQRIAAGETVTLAMQAANRDPARFPHGDRLDIRQSASGHLAFGHGLHQCVGQQLARVEVGVALPALLARIPELRLAVAAADVPMRPDANLYGAHQLPVTW